MHILSKFVSAEKKRDRFIKFGQPFSFAGIRAVYDKNLYRYIYIILYYVCIFMCKVNLEKIAQHNEIFCAIT